MKVHHIGYAVKNIEKSLNAFEKMGFHKTTNVVRDSIRKVDIVFIADRDDMNVIELIAPYEKGSDVDGPLNMWGGPAPYHVCYEVDNIEECINEFGKGCLIIKKPEIAPAINYRRVAFLYHKDLGLFEVVER